MFAVALLLKTKRDNLVKDDFERMTYVAKVFLLRKPYRSRNAKIFPFLKIKGY